MFNATSITGGSFVGDTIAFVDAGTVTANANVGNYDLSISGNAITLNDVADKVTGAAGGSDTVNLAALAYTGTVAFGASGSDAIDVTVGGDISGGAVTSGGASVALVLSAPVRKRLIRRNTTCSAPPALPADRLAAIRLHSLTQVP